MTKVQIIKTPAGEELAVLPKAEYERLAARADERMEDLGTAQLVAGAREAITAGREIVLAKEVADRLATGDNPIRVLREWRDMTQGELVVAVGITQPYLSDLESGRRRGPANLLNKIARALGVPLDLLVV
jgi:DNA-binding XRE family transcriptional regulator